MPTPPWNLLEVLERIETGPVCMEKDFDARILAHNLKRVVKEYGITYDPEIPVLSDDSLVDNAWKAAWDLYLSVGTYCTTTHRRVLFKEEEIKEALALLIDKIRLGYGKDAVEWCPRKVEDESRPSCLFGPMAVPCSEEIFGPLLMAYAMEPLADGVTAPGLEEVDGKFIRTGMPSEILGAAVYIMRIKEGLRRVGRPGLFTLGGGTAQSDVGQLSISPAEWGCQPTDIRFVPTISELKIDKSALNRMVHYHQDGFIPGSLVGPLYGAYAGVEGTAIIGIASHIQGLVVNQGYFTVYFPTHYKYFCNTTRELLWITSLTHQAIARNTRIISVANGFAAAGPCTDMVLYESAAHGLVSTVSGAGVLFEMATASNKHEERTTPMEARIACETGVAVAKQRLKRKEANDIVIEIVKKYEGSVDKAPLGKKFRECYDVVRKKPTKEYIELYRRVKKELENIGITYPY